MLYGINRNIYKVLKTNMRCQNNGNVLSLLLLVEVFMGEAVFDQSLWMPEILVHEFIKKKDTMDFRERKN